MSPTEAFYASLLFLMAIYKGVVLNCVAECCLTKISACKDGQ